MKALMLVAGFTVAANPANASSGAEAALLQAIQTDSNLTTLFSNTRPMAVGEGRAEAVTENVANRYAAVAFRPVRGDNATSSGRMFCHAALLRPESIQLTKRVLSRVDDRLLAEEIVRRSSASATFRRVQDTLLPGDDGWATAVCQVALSDLIPSEMPVIDSETMASASYDVAKALFYAGRRDEALERFRLLRSSAVYVNGVLYVVALLSQSDPTLADNLRAQVVDLEKVTDSDALSAYADAMAAVGEVDAEIQARRLVKRQR